MSQITYSEEWSQIVNNFDSPLLKYLNFIAPSVPVTYRFDYAQHTTSLATNQTQDVRAPGANFQTLTDNGAKMQSTTINKGFSAFIEQQDMVDGIIERTLYTLRNKLLELDLKRALALAAQVEPFEEVTWAPDKAMPDTELLNIINKLAEGKGTFIRCMILTSPAWIARNNCYVLQSKDPYARLSAALSDEDLAKHLNLEGVQIIPAQYQERNKEQKLSNEIYLLGINPTDDSFPIQRFVNRIHNLPFAVYQSEEVKGISITVEQNSNIILTDPFNVVKLSVKTK